MMSVSTHYFDGEGRAHMEMCIERAFEYLRSTGIRSVVMFTGSGEGPLYALQNFLCQEEYASIKVVAVTPPARREYLADLKDPQKGTVKAGILNEARKVILRNGNIPIISANLPFKPLQTPQPHYSPWNIVSEAFGILGGGVALCIQAILIACDAGEIDIGERVVALTADTAIVAWASRTETFLSPQSGLLLEHFICRPKTYPLSKPDHKFAPRMWQEAPIEAPAESAGAQPALPPASPANPSEQSTAPPAPPLPPQPQSSIPAPPAKTRSAKKQPKGS